MELAAAKKESARLEEVLRRKEREVQVLRARVAARREQKKRKEKRKKTRRKNSNIINTTIP